MSGQIVTVGHLAVRGAVLCHAPVRCGSVCPAVPWVVVLRQYTRQRRRVPYATRRLHEPVRRHAHGVYCRHRRLQFRRHW